MSRSRGCMVRCKKRVVVEKRFEDILAHQSLESSAPCRIDMGGTLDIATFYYPLLSHHPCTFNAALNLRTTVRLSAGRQGRIRVTSKGFREATFAAGRAPFSHPLGLMFAVAEAFGVDGVHIEIHSSSPPRSALGGSSSAAVALTALLMRLQDLATESASFSARQAALLAHEIEGAVAGVPCGLQDQLAAAYGGVSLWNWQGCASGGRYRREVVIRNNRLQQFNDHVLVAYCGIPHESKNINGIWVKRFLEGRDRRAWLEILAATRRFGEALGKDDLGAAVAAMNRETAIRRKITPGVLDPLGKKLVASAVKHRCGARFTGAGGGGCVWALGSFEDISELRDRWGNILSPTPTACLLDAGIDPVGVTIHA